MAGQEISSQAVIPSPTACNRNSRHCWIPSWKKWLSHWWQPLPPKCGRKILQLSMKDRFSISGDFWRIGVEWRFNHWCLFGGSKERNSRWSTKENPNLHLLSSLMYLLTTVRGWGLFVGPTSLDLLAAYVNLINSLINDEQGVLNGLDRLDRCRL